MGPKEGIPVNLWGVAGVLLKYLDKVAFRAEAQKVGYFHKGILGIFQHVFSGIYTLAQKVAGDGDSHLFVEPPGKIGRAQICNAGQLFQGNSGVKMIMDIIHAGSNCLGI
jgi:hypothetical protein